MTVPAASRRSLLAAAGALSAASLLPRAARGATTPPTLAEEVFVWGLPLILAGRYIALARGHGVPFNQFQLSPDLATPQTHAVGPNIDTLYGFAWLDLTQGPQIITVPDTHDRYYSIQLVDAYQNSFAYIGRRATGTAAGAFAVVPPGFSGALPAGVKPIPATTARVLAFVRTLVRGPADIEAARAVHFAYRLGGIDAYPDRLGAPVARANSINLFPLIDLSNIGPGWLAELDALTRAYPPLPEDRAAFARFAPLGLGRGAPYPVAPADLAGAAAAGIARAKAQTGVGLWEVNGWTTKPNVVPFIRDPLQRAAVNLYGPATHIADEALYFGARKGPDGAPLSGANAYRLRFPAGRTPPVDAFWSLILYDKDFFLFDNPTDRYAINDRTPGLRFAPDGALDIRIQADRPTASDVNWLPAPRDGFQLTLRFYQPRAEVRDRTYRLPPLEIVAA